MMSQNTQPVAEHATVFSIMTPHLQPWLSALQHANELLPEALRFTHLTQTEGTEPSVALDSMAQLQSLPVFALTVVVQQQAIITDSKQDGDLDSAVKTWAQNNPLWQVIEVAHANSVLTGNNTEFSIEDRLTSVQTYRYILLPTQPSLMTADKKVAAAHILDDTLTAHLRQFITTLPITEGMGGDAAIDCHIVTLAQILRPHRIAFFDMDSTLIEQEVIVALAKEAGIEQEISDITESAMRGEIDFNTSFSRRMALLAGLDITLLPDIYNGLTLSAGAQTTIATLKALGYHTVLLSGGFTYFATKIAEKLGIDETHANILDSYEGLLTGKVIEPIVNKERKAELVQRIAKRMDVDISQTICVGDGANDLAMIAVADLGIAYHAKPIVRAHSDAAINATGLEGVLYVLGYDANSIS